MYRIRACPWAPETEDRVIVLSSAVSCLEIRGRPERFSFLQVGGDKPEIYGTLVDESDTHRRRVYIAAPEAGRCFGMDAVDRRPSRHARNSTGKTLHL